MKLKITGFVLAVVVVFSNIATAQIAQPTPPIVEDDGDVIKIDSRLVIVPVSVTDANGQAVSGLNERNFRISEDGKVQEVSQVSAAEKVPLEIALLFDVSASTDSMFKFEQETAAQFLRDVMRPEDRATVITVGAEEKVVQSRGTVEEAARAVKSIQPTKEQTAFYDSVRIAADYLQKNAPVGRRKVIVVISDGEDTNSDGVLKAIWAAERKTVDGSLSREQLRSLRVRSRDDAKIKEQGKVLRSLQNADTVFYSINPAGSSYQLNKMSLFGQSNLQKFADETGGTAFLPKFQPIDTKDQLQNSYSTRRNQETLTQIFKQLANELQAQYLVQYYSSADFSVNRYVKLDVGLTDPQRLRVRARQGYFVKK